MGQKFCTKCGAPLRDGAKFCIKCGCRINETDIEQPDKQDYNTEVHNDYAYQSNASNESAGFLGISKTKWYIFSIVFASIPLLALLVEMIVIFATGCFDLYTESIQITGVSIFYFFSTPGHSKLGVMILVFTFLSLATLITYLVFTIKRFTFIAKIIKIAMSFLTIGFSLFLVIIASNAFEYQLNYIDGSQWTDIEGNGRTVLATFSSVIMGFALFSLITSLLRKSQKKSEE